MPTADITGTLDTVNSLYEEPFFSCRQGRGSPPPAATGSPFPIRAVSEQHLHAVLSLVHRTGRRSIGPLAPRTSGNRFGNSQPIWPEAFPDGLLSRGSSLSHSCQLKLCICGKLFQILILLPSLHSPRRFCSGGYPNQFPALTSAEGARLLVTAHAKMRPLTEPQQATAIGK